MATSRQFLDGFLEHTQGMPIAVRAMMGEYLVYYDSKLIGDICDDTFLVKPTASAKAMLPSAPMRPPYPGAKDMIVVESLEDGDFLGKLFAAMHAELPEPKKKKK